MSQGKGLGLAEMLVQQLTRAGAAGSAAASPVNPTTGTTAPSPAAASATSSAAPQASAAGGRGASLKQRIGFVQTIAPYVQRAAAALGVSADTLIAQAALETGWGQHVVQGTAGTSSNNLFNVKAGATWQGATASASTTEYDGSSAQHLAQAFRSYASIQQGVNDYVSLLQGRPAYAAALGSGSDASAFAGALQHGGYATDPDYVHKLVATSATVRSLRSFKLVAGVPIQGGKQPA
jgi:flagellar protein FlgJ